MYKSILNVKDTQLAIKEIRDYFENELAKNLNLSRASAPLFVLSSTGINDNLSGLEKPIEFSAPNFNSSIQIIHSLAKWKRMALKKYDFNLYQGLYTDMNAIRKDEHLDEIHSLYVDQWDWEVVVKQEDRNIDTLKKYVINIMNAIHLTSLHINELFPQLNSVISNEIYFITSQELLDKYPNHSAKERERLIAKEYGSVFIIGIGASLSSNSPHDNRAPDYDDWQLNGDLLIYFETLDIGLELSSMGIRVDNVSLLKQLELSNKLDYLKLDYHQEVINNLLPFTIGGGIGQSRLCQLLLKKKHIGEVQASVWPEEILEYCRKNNISLL